MLESLETYEPKAAACTNSLYNVQAWSSLKHHKVVLNHWGQSEIRHLTTMHLMCRRLVHTRDYSNVQLDTKCAVEKCFCAVENQNLCSYFSLANKPKIHKYRQRHGISRRNCLLSQCEIVQTMTNETTFNAQLLQTNLWLPLFKNKEK